MANSFSADEVHLLYSLLTGLKQGKNLSSLTRHKDYNKLAGKAARMRRKVMQ